MKLLKNHLYSREECVNLLRDHSKKPGQQAYFTVKNKSGTKVLAKVIFIKKESIYDDQIIDPIRVQWNDSIGKTTEKGVSFLHGDIPIFVFHEGDSKPVKYYFVGEVDNAERIAIGDKSLGTPDKFILKFKEKISALAHESFSDPVFIEKNRDMRENALNSAYGAIDPIKAAKIGEAGEKIFYETLSDKRYFYDDLKKFLSGVEIVDYIWLNQKTESFKPYDFRINGQFYDVKTTITNNEKFFVSGAELKLIEKNELNIVLIWLDEKLKFKNQKIINSSNVLKSYKFTGKNYLATRR